MVILKSQNGEIMKDKCKPCWGISCPHWMVCFPELETDIKELDEKIKQLKIKLTEIEKENKRYHKICLNVMNGLITANTIYAYIGER